ncbi:unnamed protein product [Owenia fusiformis]|uniref:Uncharacterized protein n=1 Tax=Owenia fusiformis TaxID=6347 RepID=A0A8J1Y3J9_OWEFU|nr:unnamed protein product [Owenia fusiformis]
MTSMGLKRLNTFLIGILCFSYARCQVTQLNPSCSGISGILAQRDPVNVCRYYWCILGRLYGPFLCPRNNQGFQTSVPTSMPAFGSPCTITLPAGSQCGTAGSVTGIPFITTPRQISQRVVNFHIQNGVKQVGISTEARCIAQCRAMSQCVVIDFNYNTQECFHHTRITGCNPPLQLQNNAHVKLLDCASTAAPTTALPTQGFTTAAPVITTAAPAVTTAAPAVTTAAPLITTAVTQSPQTSAPAVGPGTQVPPTGFVMSSPGMHIVGGTEILPGQFFTQQQCLNQCLMDANCLAVDYNAATMQCFFHGTLTYCNTPRSKTSCTHFKRVSCNPSGQNNLVEIRSGFHLFGGSPTTCLGFTTCSANTCVQECCRDPACSGVDFDQGTRACFKHTDATECTTLNAKNNCTHYRKRTCPGTIISPGVVQTTAAPGGSVVTEGPATVTAAVTTEAPSGGPIAADTTGFVQISQPGPTVLPCNSYAYPGMNIDGGQPFPSNNLSGDQCIAMCMTEPTCMAVDFNSQDGSCWAHTNATMCGQLNSNSGNYHVKFVVCAGQTPVQSNTC